jgi:hypothetical protein
MRELIAFVGVTIAVLTGLYFLGPQLLGLRSGARGFTQVQQLEQIGNGLTQEYLVANNNYGTGAIAPTPLVTSGYVPASQVISGTLNSTEGQPMTITGTGPGFSVALNIVSPAICTYVLGDEGLSALLTSVEVGTGAAQTVPLAPPTPANDCAGTGPFQVTLNYIGH